MANNIAEWIEVSVDLRQSGKPDISYFQQTCAWLDRQAESQWFHNGVTGKGTITFLIKDPKVAMLFKLIWG
jgi:hypothetical protein